MTLLENEPFLAELGKLFEKSRSGGPKTLSITMKRYNGRTKPAQKPKTATSPPSHLSSATTTAKEAKEAKGGPQQNEKLCLVRAKLGGVKISSVIKIHAKETNKFLLAYMQVMKVHTSDALKKREK